MNAKTRQPALGQWPDASGLMRRLHACCLARGWDLQTLAQRAGISRTTLYLLQQGNVRRPRISTLQRLADALSMTLPQLLRVDDPLPPARLALDSDASRQFDRQTNHAIQHVLTESPHLFTGWRDSDWDELYSTFGHGGELNPDGVATEAVRINQRRETERKVAVVLETHLRDVALEMIDSLYRMVAPECNLERSSQLNALIEQARQPTANDAPSTLDATSGDFAG